MRWRDWIICSIVIIYGCSTESESSLDDTTQYQLISWSPVDSGFWREYQVDSIFYSLIQGDTQIQIRRSSGFIRETIVDTLFSSSPATLRLLLEFRRLPSDPYRFLRYHSLYFASSFIQRNEDNLRIVTLQAPIRSSTIWKGNRFVDTSSFPDFQDWDYRYEQVNQPSAIGAIPFDTTCLVVQIADSNAIEKKYCVEQYAKKVGLIYSERSFLYKQNGANPWSMPENGYTIRKQIINWRR